MYIVTFQKCAHIRATIFASAVINYNLDPLGPRFKVSSNILNVNSVFLKS